MDSLAHKKALSLSYFTIVYNVIEGILSVFAGGLSGSIALTGFGMDSFIESISGGIMIWRFRKHGKISEEEEERAEKKALKLVSYAFFVLAAYVIYESLHKLITNEPAKPSLFGVIIADISMIVMIVLFSSKYKTGKKLNSKSLIADSKQTLACIFLSVALLAGVGMNYLFGFWQADPIAGIIIAIFLAKEGYNSLKEEKLCNC